MLAEREDLLSHSTAANASSADLAVRAARLAAALDDAEADRDAALREVDSLRDAVATLEADRDGLQVG